MSSVEHPYTPTEADWKEYEADMAMLEYEERRFNVRCSICGATDCDSQMHLEKKGWALMRTAEYCPGH